MHNGLNSYFGIRASLLRLGGVFKRFGSACSGTSALEFAMILPVLVILILGTAEWSRYSRYERHLTRTTKMIAEIVAASVQTSGNFYESNVHAAESAVYANFPEIATGDGCGSPWCDLYSQVSVIKFTPTVATCKIGCNYTGKLLLAWWLPYCGAVNAVPSGSDQNIFDVDQSMFGPGYIVKVVQGYTYRPLLFGGIFPARTWYKVAYSTPMASSTFNVVQTTPSQFTVCP